MSDLTEDQHLKIIKSIIFDKNESTNASKISEKFKLSQDKSNDLLIKFILSASSSSDLNLNSLIVIFSADIISNEKITTVIIPSFSSKLDTILNNPGLIRLNILSVESKKEDYLLNDYSMYFDELVEEVHVEKNINTNTNNIYNSLKAKSPGKKSPAKSKIKVDKSKEKDEVKEKVDAFSSNSNINNNRAKTANTKIESKSNSNNSFNTNLNSLKSSNTSNSNNNNNVNNNINYNINNSMNNKESSKNLNLKSYEDVGKIQEEPDDEYFYGGKPKNHQNSVSDFNECGNNENSNITSASGINISEGDKRKKIVKDDKSPSKMKHELSKQQNSIQHEERNNLKNDNKNNIPSRSASEESSILKVNNKSQKEPKRIQKTRKVKKTNKYFDEDGFLQTRDEYVDEIYSEDEVIEKPKKPVIAAAASNNNIDKGVNDGKKNAKKTTKTGQNQGNIMSFYKKK